MRRRNNQQFGARLPFIFLGWLSAVISGAAQTHVVQKYMGNSATTTSTFTVGDNWEVAWEDPSPVRLTLYSLDGKVVAGAAGVVKGSFYLPKGGTYYLQVDSATSNPVGPWNLSIVEQGNAPVSGANATSSAQVSFMPQSASPAAPGTNAVSAATPTVAPAKLTDDQTNAVVMIEGDKAEGTGFLVKLPDGPAVVTNIHVIAGNPNVRILTNTGAQIAILGLKGATDRDLAVFSVQDAHYSYLTLNNAIGSSVQVGDDVITPGNSQGGEVVLATHGSVMGVGPQRIEINNPIYHGNSGGPVFQTKTGKVLGVVTEAIKVDTGNELDKDSFASQQSAITGPMRYFALRLDTVPQWESFDATRFLNETTFLENFHQQSRCLDSYLNSSDKTDSRASSNDDDENEHPSSKLYLTDAKIVKADDQFFQQANGGDASERLDAFRDWVFSLGSIADSNMDSIQNLSNFYTFDQQRAREEISYRKALKTELDSFGDDINRVESLGHRSN